MKMSIKNNQLWYKIEMNNTDEYAKQAIDFARFWAESTEEMMANGVCFPIAYYKSQEVAEMQYGVTVAQFSSAKLLLKKCWKYGTLATAFDKITNLVSSITISTIDFVEGILDLFVDLFID